MLLKDRRILVDGGEYAATLTRRLLLDIGVQKEWLTRFVHQMILPWFRLRGRGPLRFLGWNKDMGHFLLLWRRRRRQLLLRWTLHRVGLWLWRWGHVRNRLLRQLSGRLWRGHRMAPGWLALRWLVREGSRSRRPSLFVHIRLHLVRVRLLLTIGILWVRLR